jgi:hypothetical protein
VELAGLDRQPQRLLVRVGERQHLAAGEVLRHARHQPCSSNRSARTSIVVGEPRRRRIRYSALREDPHLTRSEAVEHVLVAAPAAPDADLEVEVDLGAQLAFERAAGGGADLADLGAALADQDALLRLGLGPDLGADVTRPSSRRRPRSTVTSTEWGISSRVRFSTCSRISSASSSSLDWSLWSSGG